MPLLLRGRQRASTAAGSTDQAHLCADLADAAEEIQMQMTVLMSGLVPARAEEGR